MNHEVPVIETAYPAIWRRVAAYAFDYFILFAALISFQAVVYIAGRGFPYKLLRTGAQIELWIFVSISLPVWLNFSLSESSIHRATFGKRLFGLQVADLRGERIGFGRAFLRTVIKLIPWELTHLSLMLPVPLWWAAQPGMRPGIWVVYGLLAIYLLTMALSKRRQSIHDLVAGTIVIDFRRRENLG